MAEDDQEHGQKEEKVGLEENKMDDQIRHKHN